MTKKGITVESDFIVNDEGSLKAILERVKRAQESFSTYTQNQIDEIFYAVAKRANKERIPFAEMAIKETNKGILEDKVIKNHLASEFVFNKYKNEKTCGVIESDYALGIEKIAEPIGVIGAIIPVTNPTSTAIFKILLALKTRNGIIISPHPKAKNSTIQVAKVLLETAVEAGAPRDIIAWIDMPGVELTKLLMSEVDLILATGGPNMVKAAYSSGKPAIGVGAGNTPVIIDDSADIKVAVSSVIHSKTFDNGMVCSSEQAIIALSDIYDRVRSEFEQGGCYFLNEDEKSKLREIITKNGALNAEIVGKSAHEIASMAQIQTKPKTKILIAEVDSTDSSEIFACEKLSPILGMYKANDFDGAMSKACAIIENGGLGHTASVYLDEKSAKEKLDKLKNKMKACRILVNSPSSQGGVGDVYNFGLAPSLTLGCGSWGGNSSCENIGTRHLLNIKTVASRRKNMLWFKIPEKIYINRSCLRYALDELREMNKKRAIIVTDKALFAEGYYKPICDILAKMSIEYEIIHNVEPDPTLESVIVGTEQIRAFSPDTIIAFGGGSAMDAAKVMWALYEHPELDFSDMALTFADIRKRIYSFPTLGQKAYFVAIPTSAGTGSEITPFAVITDEKRGIKYPLADYELVPDMAIIDADFHLSAPRSLTSASGIDALVHAIEAYTSVMATDISDAAALHAIKLIFEYLPIAYENGDNIIAREKMANASALAAMAFANAFLGVCHSMAHKLGSFHHLPHGISNALLIEHIIRFNADVAPAKMGTFPQYEYPKALRRYAEIADALKISHETDEQALEGLIKAINELKGKIGIKATIKDYSVDEDKFISSLDEMSREAFDDQCTGASPRYPLISEIREMYLYAYYGRK